MARKLRVEYEGALYHVINHGNYRADIFRNDGAKFAFLTTFLVKRSRKPDGWCTLVA